MALAWLLRGCDDWFVMVSCMSQEIYALISHVSRYSEAVDHLMITILRLFYQDHYIHASHATLNPID